MAVDKTIYSWSINNNFIPPSGLVLTSIIDLTHTEANSSPIDTFITKNTELNKLLLDPNNVKSEINRLQSSRKISSTAYTSIDRFIINPANVSPVLANLVLLGHISAVESYFRELFRRVILIDEVAQTACREKLISYSAALTYKEKALPDALLEQTNFSSSHNIKNALKDFLGIAGDLPSSVISALKDYANICQLRHCIVHKFGKLGVNNALKLDWHNLKSHVDKPVKVNYTSLQEVSQICFNLVKEANNFCWQIIMMRQIGDGTYNSFKKKSSVSWAWVWKTDRAKFKNYYELFFSSLAPPTINNMKQAYDQYKTKYTALL